MLRLRVRKLVSMALLASAVTIADAARIAYADDFYREDLFHREDLRIPFAAAGPRGLEAMLLRPAAAGHYPLALISHGSPRNIAEYKAMSPYRLYAQAVEFARRGFAALVVMRRGFGTSEGHAPNGGSCAQRNYLAEVKEQTADLQAATEAAAKRPDVTTQGMIAIGESGGGFASIALTANPPPGLAAVINFAGGRGSRGDNDVCQEDQLVSAFATFGKTSRVPTLWIYARNDLYFEPTLAWRFYRAFANAGGNAEFISANPFGKDGHTLFANGIAVWMPTVDKFLREHELGASEPLDPPKPLALQPPAQLNALGKRSFSDYLAAGPHKAFAVSANGEFASAMHMRSADEARRDALQACMKSAVACTIYAVDNELTKE
jgi:dienelactone hydrolase